MRARTLLRPLLGNGGIARQTELREEGRHHAIKGNVGEEFGVDEIEEALDSQLRFVCTCVVFRGTEFPVFEKISSDTNATIVVV